MEPIELSGLNGGNLLGFLAAVGTLRVLGSKDQDTRVRMNWTEKSYWAPVLHHSQIGTSEELVAALEQRVCGQQSVSPACEIGNDLTLPREQFREHLLRQMNAAERAKRNTVDFLAAFGSEVYGSGPKKERMSDTEFRTMSGAGHQHFLSFMRELAAITDAQHLKRTLFEPWDYSDDRPSLRWDPADYRPHALRADDPKDDPIKTMRGANRLAVEALPLFPTVPKERQVCTIGFEDRDGQTEVTWPIWIEPLDVNTVASLLASAELQQGDRTVMGRRGIAQIFRARRFTDGKYRNFSPAKALL